MSETPRRCSARLPLTSVVGIVYIEGRLRAFSMIVYPPNNPTQHSIEETESRLRAESLSAQQPAQAVTAGAASDAEGHRSEKGPSSPPWSIPEVLALAAAAIVVVILSLISVGFLANRFVFHQPSLMEAMQRPAVAIVGQTV